MRIQRVITVKRNDFLNLTMGYQFNCELLTSVDYGKNFYHCGYGKFCKTEEEAREYINNQMERQAVTSGFMKNLDLYQTEIFQFPSDKKLEQKTF